jgi:ATP-dependent DNA helicase RecG
MIAPMPSAISLNTPVEDLHNFKIARLGPVLSRKLARALTAQVHKKSTAEVTVEDLLTYFPMRYEDRSRPALIRDLHDGVEASLELTVTNAHGYAVRNPRSYGRPRLYIFEVSGIDGPMSGREVIVWWFVSGPRAYDIVKYYTDKLVRGTKFITYGRWEWEARRNTYKLRLNKPADELEVLPTAEAAEEEPQPDQDEENLPDPALAAIHVGRRVPVYRKLGEFNSKRVREIVHAVLALLDDKAIEETLPADLRHRTKLIGRAQALHEIHFPPPDASMDDYELSKSAAHERMIFEDFFWVTFAIGLKRGQRIKEEKEMPLRIDKTVNARIASVLPFKLTKA